MYQLTKTIKIIKPEFDKLNLKIFGGFAETERCLYDLNNLFHRMKYFLRNGQLGGEDYLVRIKI